MLLSRLMPSPVDEEEVYRRFARRVRLYGLRHLRDEQAADDLVQDVLFLVIQKLRAGEVREPERLASFVLGTCRMVVRNKVRGEARRRALLERFDIPADPTEPSAGARLDVSRLVDCMAKLSERARTVTVLTFYADRSATEIAEEMWVSANNVRVMRHRALAALQQCMEVS